MLEKHDIHYTPLVIDGRQMDTQAVPVLSKFDWKKETDGYHCLAKDLRKNNNPCGYSKNEPKNYIHAPECDIVEMVDNSL